MSATAPSPISVSHRFLDESGDTTFFRKGRIIGIGEEGISRAFSLGMVKFNTTLADTRLELVGLQKSVEADKYLNRIPSVAKKIAEGGYYFHATDDPPEVRERMMRFIAGTDCSLEMVVGRKIPTLFARKHNGREVEFYADLLSHLIKNKLRAESKLVLNIAARGAATKNANLQRALEKATERFVKTRSPSEIRASVVFNVQNPRTEPLLCVADYLCWSVQRIFERGETRYYDFLIERISLVVDLYDADRYAGSRNYYRKGSPLTATNKISPLSP